MDFINQKQYNQLCEFCDEILYNNLNFKNIIAIQWLHVIRYHPIFINQYRLIFEKVNTLKFILFLAQKVLRYFIKSFIDILISINYGYKTSKEHNNYNSIFITHLLNREQLELKEDFYFFNFPNILKNPSEKNLIIYINHIDNNYDFQNFNLDCKEILSPYLGIKDELKFRIIVLKNFFRIFKNVKTNNQIQFRIKLQAAVESFSPSTISNIRIGVQIQNLVRIVRPKFIFHTYEGHSLERVIFHSAKNSKPDIKCIAYQHSLIFDNQHSIFRKLSRKYDPDFIMCSGKNGFEKLKKSGLVKKDNILLVGSNRTNKSSQKLELKSEIKDLKILFLPEGDLIECIPMLKMAITLALGMPLDKFIFRLHPITSLEKLMTSVEKVPDNLEISNLSLEDDFKRSFYAIYRGSTTIIKAIEFGLIPIYYNYKNTNINPINNVEFQISNLPDFLKIRQIPKNSILKKQKEIKNNIDNYFSELNYQVFIKKFIE